MGWSRDEESNCRIAAILFEEINAAQTRKCGYGLWWRKWPV